MRSWSICLQCLERFKSKKDTEVDGRGFQEPDKFLSHLFYPANGVDADLMPGLGISGDTIGISGDTIRIIDLFEVSPVDADVGPYP